METKAPEGLRGRGEHVARLRRERFLTQDELASKAGVSVDTLYRIEQGRTTSIRNARKVAKALGVEPGEVAAT